MLSTNVCKLKLRNPTILASGILGSTGASLKRVAKHGAGAVVTKSIGKMPREGHKNPTIIELGDCLINAIGLANPGYKAFVDEIKIAKQGNVPVIASIFGRSIEEYVEVAKGLQDYADAIELNLSCPNIEGKLFAQDAELSYEVVREVRKVISKPVIAKLTASVADIVEIAKACEEAGANGITAINTIKAMKIDINFRKPILANKTGGLSGRCIKPIALRCVYEIASEVSIDIIGCGGIASGEDALEFLMAGAKAIEIGTGVYLHGLSIFKKVCKEIEEYLRKHDLGLQDIIGSAL